MLRHVVALTFIALLAGPACATERPNIILVVADDLGWTDLACFGSKYYETPNLDKLASQGVRFTSAYTSGPNCAPTRAALISGQQYPNNPIYTVASGARGQDKHRKMIPVQNVQTLPLSHVTIAESLKKAGYVTAHMGKWHLGDPAPKVGGPKQQGFDINVGGNHSGSPRGGYFAPYKNSQLEQGPKGEYLTDRLAAEAVKFIEAHHDKSFFLYLPHYSVHTPIQAPKDRAARFAKKQPVGGHKNAEYAAMIEAVDMSVGRIMATLDKHEIADNTIVIFYSDNGGHGQITSNKPLRGAKGMLYEGGVRVPMIVRYPGVAPAGGECKTPIVSTDFYPTFLELGKAETPSDYQLDGVSIAPLIRDPRRGRIDRDAIYWHFPGYLQAYGPGNWRTTPAGAIRSGDYKLIEFFETGTVELYNVAKDIGEQHDLSERLPEKTRELHDKLKAWRKSVDAPMPTMK